MTDLYSWPLPPEVKEEIEADRSKFTTNTGHSFAHLMYMSQLWLKRLD